MRARGRPPVRRAVPAGLLVLAALLPSIAGCNCRSKTRLSRGDAAVVVADGLAAAPSIELAPSPSGALDLSSLVTADRPLEVRPNLTGAELRFEIKIPGAGDAGAPPEQLAIELAPPPGLALALVAEASQGPLARVAGGPGEAIGLPNLEVRFGELVTLRVRRANRPAPGTATSFGLSVRRGPRTAADEIEPNETAALATVLPPAHTSPEIAGYLGGREDRDWFHVPLGAVAESTVLTVELEPPPDVAAAVSVYDLGQRRLAGGKSGKGTRFALRQIAAPTAVAPVDGGVAAPALLVSVETAGAGDRKLRYTLRVRAEEGGGGEREPNDDAASASRFPEAGAASGYLGPGDVDVFRVDARAGQALAVTVQPPRRADLVLEAQLPGETRWARADVGKRGQPEVITLTPPGDGVLLIRVTQKRGPEYDEEPYRIEVGPAGATAPRGGTIP